MQGSEPSARVAERDFKRYTLAVFYTLVSLWTVSALFVLAVATFNATSDRDGTWRRFGANHFHLQDQLARLTERKYALAFGTSRSNQLSEAIVGRPLLNLNYLYGNPVVVADLLEQLSDAHWRNVDRIYYLVDVHTLDASASVRDVDTLLNGNSIMDIWWHALATLKFGSIATSLRDVTRNLTGEYPHYIAADGEVVPVSTDRYSGVLPIQACDIQTEKPKLDAAPVLTRIREVARRRGVEVYFYTGIFTSGYAFSQRDLIAQHARVVLKHLDDFYLFYFAPEISNDFSLFIDESHLTLKGLKQQFALDWSKFQVDGDSLERRLGALRTELASIDLTGERRACD